MGRINSRTFKPIQGYEGLYDIYSDGSVYSYITGKFLKPQLKKVGYWKINLYGGEHKSRAHKISVLKAQAFIPNPLNKATVNHKNGIKSDDRLENLEWATQVENLQHAHKLGLVGSNSKAIQGNKFASKVTWEIVNKIRANTSKSRLELMTEFGLSSVQIWRIINYKAWA